MPVVTAMGSSLPWPRAHRESRSTAVEPQRKLPGLSEVCEQPRSADGLQSGEGRTKSVRSTAWGTEAHADFLRVTLHLPACLVVLSGGFIVEGELSDFFCSAFVLLR